MLILFWDRFFAGKHSNKSDIRNEWGYDVYFNSYSSKSRGVAIFFDNDFEFTVHKEITDDR